MPRATVGAMRVVSLTAVAASATLAVVVAASSACPSSSPPPGPPAPVWAPGTLLGSEGTDGAPGDRGFSDVRGLVHAHSVYSHDACDGEPVDADGVRDSVCFDDFRRGLCQSQHDFVFLTDHGDSFAATEFPEALLYRPDLGDELVQRGADVAAGGSADGVANRVTCDDGHTLLIMAGSENGLMPVGLERHIEARALYGEQTEAAATALRDAGAVVLLAHPEDFSVEELLGLPIDGFEMFNLHANTVLGAGFALDLLLRANDNDPGVPHPDLLVLALYSEDARYLNLWGNVLASGKRVVSTMGTDCHRNTFRTILEDGERADSYRRMMIAFSNHLRVKPAPDGSVDDAALKEALASGRVWGAFEMLGYPVGFDAVAVDGSATYEMGDTVPVGAHIRASMPAVRDLDPSKEPPHLTLRLLKAEASDAGFVEVASSDSGDLDVVVAGPGAYRVEVRMMPLHLRQDLRDEDRRLLDEAASEYPWIYANPFYVQ